MRKAGVDFGLDPGEDKGGTMLPRARPAAVAEYKKDDGVALAQVGAAVLDHVKGKLPGAGRCAIS